MPCTASDSSLFQQVICILDELNVVYTDCDGVVQGDCGMCAGTNGEIVTNSVIFNPGSNQLTTIVNGIAASAIIGLDTTDVTTSGPLTINGVLYAAGTALHTILNAIIAISHKSATLHANNNPALSLDAANQVFKLDLTASGSYDNSVSGLAADNIQDAIDEVVSNVSGLPTGTVGDTLIHNGTEFVPVTRFVDDQLNESGVTLTMGQTPLAFAPFDLYRNGAIMIVGEDYTRVGATVTLVAAASNETFKAIYYI